MPAPLPARGSSQRITLWLLLAVLSVVPLACPAEATIGAEDTDACSMTTLIYGDEAIAFAPVSGALTTSANAAGAAIPGAGFTFAASASEGVLPAGPHSLLHVADGSCSGGPCLRNVYLEVDLRVPHPAAMADTLTLYDVNGKQVLAAVIPDNQQIRFTLEDHTVINRVRVELAQTSAPEGDLGLVASVWLTRQGQPGLDTIDSNRRSEVYWHLTSLRFRNSECKECGAAPLAMRRENAIVMLAPDGDTTELLQPATVVSNGATDVSAVVDPGCKCLAPSSVPSRSPTVVMDVLLRHRNVWPHKLSLETLDGVTVWEATIPRASAVNSWQTVTFQVAGRDNLWNVAPTSGGGDGPLPPWDELLVVMRRASPGNPDAGELPLVRNVRILGSASTDAATYAAYLVNREVEVVASTDTRALLEDPDAAPAEGLVADYTDATSGVAQSDLEAAAGGTCSGDCGDGYLAVDVTATAELGAPVAGKLLLAWLQFKDVGGAAANVTVPQAGVVQQTASVHGERMTLWLPLTNDYVTAESGFDWSAIDTITPFAVGPPPASRDEASARGALRVGHIRLGVPLRIGHVSEADTYKNDDMACDPLTGWFDSGGFTTHDVVKYSHCRECCCFFDDPSSDPATKHCYDQANIIADVTPAPDMAPNDQCVVCNRHSNAQVMTPRETLAAPGGDPFACDDLDACSYADHCTDAGACVATAYTTCLSGGFTGGDPAQDCEECDGTGPFGPTQGCKAKAGHFVHWEDPVLPARSCACLIDGVLYPHLALNPEAPCVRCDVTADNTAWTLLPDDTACDITAQWDWENLATQACTYKHVCAKGVCVGDAYDCPPVQSCEAPADSFPHVCDLSGPASETGGCQKRVVEKGVVCAPEIHGCVPEAVCNGVVGTCPPQLELPGIIYEDATKALQLRLPDGSSADEHYPVIPSLDSVVAEYRAFRVQCGELQLRMAVIPAGECSLDRVTPALGGGWRSDFSAPPRGSYALVSRHVELTFDPVSMQYAMDANDGLYRGRHPTLIRLDDGVKDYSRALVAEFRSSGVPQPFLDLEIRRERGTQLLEATLVDGRNRTIPFRLPGLRVEGEWAMISARGDASGAGTADGFDWTNVQGLRLELSAASLSGVPPGSVLFGVRRVRIRTRASGPPCGFVLMAPRDGSSEPVEALAIPRPSAVDEGAYSINFTGVPVDAGLLYDTAQSMFKVGTILSLEVLGPAPGVQPVEVEVLCQDGGGFVAPLLTDATPVPLSDHPGLLQGSAPQQAGEWVRVIVPIRRGMLVSASTASFAAITSVVVRFRPSETHGVKQVWLRHVHFAQTEGCAQGQAASTLLNGGLDMFVGSSATPDLVLEPTAGSTALQSTIENELDVIGPEYDLDLDSFWDEDCACFPDAVLEVDVTQPNAVTPLTRIDFVQKATGHGLRLDLPTPVAASATAPAGDSLRRTIRLRLDVDSNAVTVLGPPESWSRVNTMFFWRGQAADAAAENIGSIVLHSIRVRRTELRCIHTTTLSSGAFVAPAGVLITGAGETPMALSDTGSGQLVRTTGQVVRRSRQAGVWREGAGAGGSEATAIAVVEYRSPDSMPHSQPASVAVTAGIAEGGAQQFSGVPLGTSDTPQGIVGGRNGRTGLGMWAVPLGARVRAEAVSAAASTSLASDIGGSVVVLVGRATHEAGVSVTVGGATSSTAPAGGLDFAAIVLRPDTGEVLSVATTGSAEDDEWMCVSSSHATRASHESLLVLGGTTSGAPSGLSLQGSGASGAAASVAVVAAYTGVDALDGPPEWAMSFGSDADAVDAVVRSVAVVATPRTNRLLVVAGGTYANGGLVIDDTMTLAESSDPASQTVFVVALNAVNGSVVWAHAFNSGNGTPLWLSGSAALAASTALPSRLVFCADAPGDAGMGDDRASVVSLLPSDGSLQWSTDISPGQCGGVAVSPDAVTVGGAGSGQVTVSGTATESRVVHGIPDTSGKQSLITRLDPQSGAWLDGEYFGSVTASGQAYVQAVASDPQDDGATVWAAGAATGPLLFGSNSTGHAALRDGSGGAATRAFVSRFFASSYSSGADAPTVRYRDGGAAVEKAAALLVTKTSYVVATAVASTDIADSVVGDTPSGASSSPGVTFGAVHRVNKDTGVSSAHLVLGPDWGVKGESAIAGVAPSSDTTVIAACYVNSVLNGVLVAPATGERAGLPFPATQEPVVFSVDANGDVEWMLATEASGATRGHDTVVGIGYDIGSRTAAVAGSTDIDDLAECNYDLSSPATCTSARLTVMRFAAGASQAPTEIDTVYLSGDAVSADVTSLSVGKGGVVAVAGTMHRVELAVDVTAEYTNADLGKLHVPGSLRPGSSAARGTTGPGIMLETPPSGAAVGWVAVYGGGRADRALLWAGLVATSDGANRIAVSAALVAGANVALCGHVGAATVVLAAVRADVSVQREVPHPIAGSDGAVSFDGPAAVSGEPTAFIAALDSYDGGVRWTKFVSGAAGTTCQALAEVRGGIAAAGELLANHRGESNTLQVGPAVDNVDEGADASNPLPLGPTATLWVAQLGAVTGSTLARSALGSTPTSSAEHEADTRDTVGALATDHASGTLLVAASTHGGTMRASSDAGLESTLRGQHRWATRASLGSWNVVVCGLSTSKGTRPAGARVEGVSGTGAGAEKLRTTFAVAVSSATAADLANIVVGAASDTAAAPGSAAGLGFTTGVSVGATRTLAVGYYKGTLALDSGGAHIVTAGGDVGDPAASYDSLGVWYRESVETVTVEGTLLTAVSGGVGVDDRFRAATPCASGSGHLVAGHATVAAAGASIQVGDGAGAASVSMPGDGFRDGLLARVSDADGSVDWVVALGAVAGSDDALLAVASLGDVVVVAGEATGAVPTVTGGPVYDGAVGGRTLATVYKAATTDGAVAWGRAFGLDVTTGAGASCSAVAVDTNGGVAIAGSFQGGVLVMSDAIRLDPPAGAPGARTAFVAYLDGSTGGVMWARAANTGAAADAASFSVVRGLAASASVVVATGEFHYPGPEYITMDSDDVEEDDQTRGTAYVSTIHASGGGPDSPPHGFAAVFDSESGSVSSLDVPECPGGCRAGGVALSGARAYVAYTYVGAARFGGGRGFSVGDWEAPTQHRGALVVYGGAPGRVEAVQRLGGGAAGVGHVDAAAVAVGPTGRLAVGGWRSGDVTLPGLYDALDGGVGISGVVGANGRTVSVRESHAPAAAPFGATVEFQPFVASFDTASRATAAPFVPSNTAMSQVPVAIAMGTVQTKGHSLGDSVASIEIALGAATALTSVHSRDLGNTTLYATERHTGQRKWTGSVAGVVTASCSNPGRDVVCVAGNVDDATSDLPVSWSPAAVGGGTGGGGDAFVTCYADRPVSFADAAEHVEVPLWTSVVSTAATAQAATAVATSDDEAWVALTTTGPMTFGETSIAHAASALASPPPLCVVGVLDIATGAAGDAIVFGGTSDGDSCVVTALAATNDGRRFCIAGTFVGSPLELSASRTLTPTSSTVASPFVACYDATGLHRASQPFQLRWASGGAHGSLVPTDGATAVRISTLLFAVDGQAGGPGNGARVFIAGEHHLDRLSFGTGNSDHLRVMSSAAHELAGSGAPSTVFVASFDADVGTVDSSTLANADWVAEVSGTTRAGAQACAGLALVPGGRLLVGVHATAPIPASLSAAPLEPTLSPGATADAGSFAAMVLVDAFTGALGGGYVVADPQPQSSPQSRVESLRLVSSHGASPSASPGDDVVLVGAAVGGLASSLHAFPSAAPRWAAATPESYAVFLMGAGAVAGGAKDGVMITNDDGSAVQDLTRTGGYAVAVDVWRSGSGGAIAGGEWRAGGGAGAGIVFQVSADQQADQRLRPRQWITIMGTVAAAPSVPGRQTYGIRGGADLLAGLDTLQLHASTTALDPLATYRVRNARLVPMTSDCMPCGQVAVQFSAVSLQRSAANASLAGVEVPLVSEWGDSITPGSVDVTSLVDASCACLRGTQLTWEEMIPGPGDALAPIITAVELLSSWSSPAAGASTRRIVYGVSEWDDFSAEVATSGEGVPTWRKGVATFKVQDHARAADVDWRQVTRVRFLTRVPTAGHTPDGPHDIAPADVVVRRVKLLRECGRSAALLHPNPRSFNTSVDMYRSGLSMVRGNAYRIISTETNMWGDVAVPTCSRQFVPDDTPPSIEEATVRDVSPLLGASDDNIAYTAHQVLKVGWGGRFVEPDSAPANILLFQITNVTAGSPTGIPVQGLVPQHKLLATTSTGYVETNELPLVDGTKYFVHLGVCNRAKLCSTAFSEDGVFYDGSPPQSAALRIVDSFEDPINVYDSPASFHQMNDTHIYVKWRQFLDPDTPVKELRVGLGTAAFGTDVHELRVVPEESTQILFYPKAGEDVFHHGQSYYVVFRPINEALAWEYVRTAPLYIDVTPPEVHWVNDIFPLDLGGAAVYFTDDSDTGDVDVTDGSLIRAKFKCDDPESVEDGFRGNMTYRWRVCNTPECDEVVYVDWMDTGTTPRGATNNSAMDAASESGELRWVYVQMECTNPVGLSATASSDGVRFDPTPPDNSTVVIVDLDPRPGSIRDLRIGDVTWLPTHSLLTGWRGFLVDADKPPLVSYQLGVGTVPGKTDVQPFTSVGLSTEASTEDSTDLRMGVKYYVTVKAVTLSGASASATTDGVTLDFVDPVPTVVDAIAENLPLTHPSRCAPHLRCMAINGPDDDVDYVASTLSLTFNITNRTGIAPLTVVEYGVSTCDSLLDMNLVNLRAVDVRQTFFQPAVRMFHAQRYCAVVFYTAATKRQGYGATNGFVVDITPPRAVFLHEGSSAFTDIDTSQYPDQLNLTAGCRDAESGLHSMRVRLSRVNFATGDVEAVVVPWTVLPNSSFAPSTTVRTVTRLLTGLSMGHGEWYVATLRCVNGAGAYVDIDSDGVVHDTTAPDASGAQVLHDHHHSAIAVQVDNTTLHVSWRGFTDAESPIVSYAWAIGTHPYLSDVLSVTNVGPNTTATATSNDVTLVDGETYYITVYATNDAGLTSRAYSGGVTIDATAPTKPTGVTIEPDASLGKTGWITSQSQLDVSWQAAVDIHSNVTYRWAMGTVEYGQQILPWTYVSDATSTHLNGLSLLPGMSYFVSVEASNWVGLTTLSLSQLVVVDPFPPVAGFVGHGPSRATVYRAQHSTTRLECGWWGFEDPISGIAEYHVGFGTTRGTVDFVDFVVVDEFHHVTVANKTLTRGTTYFCTVVAYDMAGNSATVSSTGVTVDDTAPVAGRVVDLGPDAPGGSGAVDVAVQIQDNVIRGSWPGWHDSESGIVRMEWAVGSGEGGDANAEALQTWTPVPAHQTTGVYIPASSLVVGGLYFVSVRAFNGVGLMTLARSDGFRQLPRPGEGAAMTVSAQILFIPGYPHGARPSEWCACGDPAGALEGSGATYDPVSGACSCPSGKQLGLNGECVACSGKGGLGNACDLDAPIVAASAMPPTTNSLESCGADGAGKYTRPSDGACVCPPGTRSDAESGGCVACESGTINPWHADVAACRTCWEPAIPDTVLVVKWDSSELADVAKIGAAVTGFIVSAGTSAGALRWVREVGPTVRRVDFHSREPVTEAFDLSGGGIPPFNQNDVLHVRVRALVASTVVAEVHRAAPVIDYTPPISGGVDDVGSASGVVDIDVTSSALHFHASWHSFADPEWSPGIASYYVAFGTDGAGSTDLLGWTATTALRYSIDRTGSAAVPDATTVTASVRAFNSAGGWAQAASDGVQVQTEIPAGEVGVVPVASAFGAGGPGGVTHSQVTLHGGPLESASTTAIAAAWHFPSPTVLSYEWRVLDITDGSDEVQEWTAVGSRTWGVAATDDLPGLGSLVPYIYPQLNGFVAHLPQELEFGHQYIVEVRATNAAGVWRVATSPTLFVDNSAPTSAVLVQRAGRPADNAEHAGDSKIQSSSDALEVSWTCTDAETDMKEAAIVVGTVVGGDQGMKHLVRATATTDQHSHTFTGLELIHGHCYVAQVACTNQALMTGRFTASEPICIDKTTPMASAAVLHPVVLAAELEEIGISNSGRNQSHTSDPHEILALSSSVRVGSLQTGQAPDEAGLEVSHLGVLAEQISARTASFDPATPVAVSADLDLAAYVLVSAVDGESAVVHVDLSWELDDGTRLTAPVPVSLDELTLAGDGVVDTEWTYHELAQRLYAAPSAPALSSPLFAVWRAFNGAGDVTVAKAAAPLILDATAPVSGGIIVARYQFSTADVSASWSFADSETQVAGYAWSIVRSPDGLGVRGAEAVGLTTTVTVDDVELAHAADYSVLVTACNAALVCATDSAVFTVDTTAPMGGTVVLGTFNATVVDALCGGPGIGCSLKPPVVLLDGGIDEGGETVSWGGFHDPESPIVSYTVGMGTSPRGTQLGIPVEVDGDTREVALDDLAFSNPDAVDAVLFDGAALFVAVTATNAAGVRHTVVAQLLGVDERAPLPGDVTIEGRTKELRGEVAATYDDTGAEVATEAGGVALPWVVQMNTDGVNVSWTSFVEGEAEDGVLMAGDAVEYELLLEAKETGAVAAGPTLVAAQAGASVQRLEWTGLSLQPGVVYVAYVTGTDASGNSITAASMRPVLVDPSPAKQVKTPAAATFGTVRDGLEAGVDIDCQQRAGITASDPSDVVTIDNRAGQGGVIIDSLPGDNPAELDDYGNEVVTVDLFLTAADEPSARSTVVTMSSEPFHDEESGVAYVEVAVGSTPGGSNLLGWTRVPGQAGQVQVLLPVQPEGLVVYSSARAYNGVGAVAEARSDGVRMLCQPGTVGCDFDGSFVCVSSVALPAEA